MKILITGKNGQLGQQLQQDAPQGAELIALGREDLDITNRDAVFSALAEHRPDVVINAAAYTAVDRAESDVENAYAINATGPENLAQACKECGIRLVHVSTDFVFDGQKSSPYTTEDPTRPLGVYGSSKAAGEAAVQAILPEAAIVRTAWVYSVHGNNFVNTMLRLMNERDQLGVVADQVGTPTWTGTLAKALYALAADECAHGIYHCTDAGAASWYDFAVAIYEEGKTSGLIPANKQVYITPITTTDYPTPATRPPYSVLEKRVEDFGSGFRPTHWRQILREVLQSKTQ
ncbi:dTDP-4-dehydrorhamnose reductase [Microbulbifer sediminum]|uniref:dTDP-4-dehydrorhamnose reductase n=1 Tax=Microbulbifer sediminum TaxID=2904250 RepID=UPI001F00F02D|nr:dTDP-4-dehydrorhamnose reductase [Microbulbifer sediminum]